MHFSLRSSESPSRLSATWALLFVLGTLAATLAPRASATDYTEWLARRGWRVLATSSRGVSTIADVTGRRFLLRLGSPEQLQTEFAASIVAKAMGVSSVPWFPTLARRGSAGVVGPIDATTPLEEIVPALVAPEAEFAPLPEKLSNAQLVQLSVALLHRYVMAAPLHRNWHAQAGMFGLFGQHVGPTDFDNVFDDDVELPEKLFASAFDFFPKEAFLVASWHDRNRVFTALDAALARLERMSADDWDRATGFAFEVLGEPRRRGRLRARVRDARALTKAFFEKLAPQEAQQLAKAAADDAPIVAIPPRETPTDDSLPNVDLLWRYWMKHPSPEETEAIVGIAATRLKRPRGEALAGLIDALDKDMSRNYGVHPHRRPQMLDRAADRIPQLHLWPNNARTLVVVPLNDPEAQAIAAIADEAGARVLALAKSEYPHGSKLDARLAERIDAEWTREPFDRLVVVELPPRPAAIGQRYAHSRDFQFYEVDHHDYPKDRQYRHRARGSLEQVADLLGYDLSPSDHAIALFDRSFIFGVFDLGFDPKSLDGVIGTLSPELERQGDGVPSSVGPLYFLDAFAGKIGDAAAPLCVRHCPTVPSIFVVEPNDLRFSGSPALEARLTAAFEALKIPEAEHYSFGDLRWSRGWGFKQFPTKDRERVFATLRTIVGEVAGDAGLRALDAVIGQPMDSANLSWSERLRIADGRRRAQAIQSTPWQTFTDDERDRFVALAIAALKQDSSAAVFTAAFGAVTVPRYTSYDFGAFIDLAGRSGDARWRPYLEAALRDWAMRNERWHGALAERARSTLARLPQASPAIDGCVREIAE